MITIFTRPELISVHGGIVNCQFFQIRAAVKVTKATAMVLLFTFTFHALACRISSITTKFLYGWTRTWRLSCILGYVRYSAKRRSFAKNHRGNLDKISIFLIRTVRRKSRRGMIMLLFDKNAWKRLRSGHRQLRAILSGRRQLSWVARGWKQILTHTSRRLSNTNWGFHLRTFGCGHFSCFFGKPGPLWPHFAIPYC